MGKQVALGPVQFPDFLKIICKLHGIRGLARLQVNQRLQLLHRKDRVAFPLNVYQLVLNAGEDGKRHVNLGFRSVFSDLGLRIRKLRLQVSTRQINWKQISFFLHAHFRSCVVLARERFCCSLQCREFPICRPWKLHIADQNRMQIHLIKIRRDRSIQRARRMIFSLPEDFSLIEDSLQRLRDLIGEVAGCRHAAFEQRQLRVQQAEQFVVRKPHKIIEGDRNKLVVLGYLQL